MKYLLDTNSVSNALLDKIRGRSDFYIMRDVLDESSTLRGKESDLKRAGISVIEMTIQTLNNLKDVLLKHGTNFQLIDLYTGKGTADVLMLAHVLSEKAPNTLFAPELWTIVSTDGPLKDAAKTYGVQCVTGDELIKSL